MLSGANAFDVFPTAIFKDMIIEHPFKEAPLMQKDFTRVNFGWWGFYPDTRPDVYEFGTSKAAAYDCPSTMQANLYRFKLNPRINDILEVMRRWEDVRADNLLTDEHKALLRQPDKEFTLLINAKGEYELTEYAQVKIGNGEAGLTAFVFERNGKACCTLWDDRGTSTVTLEALDGMTYTKEIETEPIGFESNGENAILTVAGKAYITANVPLDTLKAALCNVKAERKI
jgi:hypothetical protein